MGPPAGWRGRNVPYLASEQSLSRHEVPVCGQSPCRGPGHGSPAGLHTGPPATCPVWACSRFAPNTLYSDSVAGRRALLMGLEAHVHGSEGQAGQARSEKPQEATTRVSHGPRGTMLSGPVLGQHLTGGAVPGTWGETVAPGTPLLPPPTRSCCHGNRKAPQPRASEMTPLGRRPEARASLLTAVWSKSSVLLGPTVPPLHRAACLSPTRPLALPTPAAPQQLPRAQYSTGGWWPVCARQTRVPGTGAIGARWGGTSLRSVGDGATGPTRSLVYEERRRQPRAATGKLLCGAARPARASVWVNTAPPAARSTRAAACGGGWGQRLETLGDRTARRAVQVWWQSYTESLPGTSQVDTGGSESPCPPSTRCSDSRKSGTF